MTIAVTSAKSYPGAHMLLCLQDAGESYLAIDQYGGEIPQGSASAHYADIELSDVEALTTHFQKYDVSEVIHFGGTGTVAQSINDPLGYYQANTVGSFGLLKACILAGVKKIVLSSTSSVYGNPTRVPISEDTPLNPISPFGWSMAMAERMAWDISHTGGVQLLTLRFFNIAGADPKLRAGEEGKPRHLIKVISQIAAGTRLEKLQIYGNDYDTPDGTCIRDYIHVTDMADAHLAAMTYLRGGGRSVTLNCGYGYGASVLDVVAATERVTGQKIECEFAARRAGDPPQLIADNAAIRSTLDWTPRYDDFDFIVRTAIDWENKCRQIAA